MLGELVTAIVTPFRPDGGVDIGAFRALCRHLVENGSDGIVVTGTTGEAPTLSDDERFALYAAAIDEVGTECSVIAGTGTYATAHSVHLTERAHEIGVDGFLVVTPYYNKPPQRGIVAHVAAIAAATDRPIVFYDIPGRVVVDAEPETISALAAIPNVRAVKQSKPSLDAARHVVAEGLDLYAGDDDAILPFLEVGGVGGISVVAHVVGTPLKEMITSYRAGDLAARARDQRRARPCDRPPARADEPHRDQDGSEPPRSRRRWLPAAARRGDTRRGGRRAGLPRATRVAAADRSLNRRTTPVRPAGLVASYPYTARR